MARSTPPWIPGNIAVSLGRPVTPVVDEGDEIARAIDRLYPGAPATPNDTADLTGEEEAQTEAAKLVQYKYNGLNYVIGRHADLDNSGTVDNTDKWEWFVYDPRWRHVATFMVAGGSTFTGSADTNPKEQYVHHAAGRFGRSSYIDSVILRNRDQTNGNNGAADGTLENREYYCQNWRADVSVTMTDTGRILEWLKYSAYGVAQRIAAADFNRDSFVDFFDDGDFAAAYGLGLASADINFDGATNSADDSQWSTTYAEQGGTARGALSQASGAPAVNRIGYAGYWFEPSMQQHLVRNRELDSLVGAWDERDPLGYHDGTDLYQYVKSQAIVMRDALGLFCSRKGGAPRSAKGIGNDLAGQGTLSTWPIDTPERCEAAVRARLDAALPIFNRLGCPLPTITCQLCDDAPLSSNMTDPLSATTCEGPRVPPRTRVCYGDWKTSDYEIAIDHEIQLALDCCLNAIPRTGWHCEQLFCSEVRAYKPLCIAQNPGDQAKQEECALLRALASVKRASPECHAQLTKETDANSMHTLDLFDACYGSSPEDRYPDIVK